MTFRIKASLLLLGYEKTENSTSRSFDFRFLFFVMLSINFTGDESVESRFMITKVLEAMAGIGYYIVSGLDC